MVETDFEIDDISIYKRLCGPNDINIRKIEEYTGVEIIPRGNKLILKSVRDKIDSALKLLHVMTDLLYLKGDTYEFDDFDLKYLSSSIIAGHDLKPDTINKLKITIPDSGKVVVPRTINQANYMTSIFNKPITFATGPAGTGKTYLAVTVGIHMLLNAKVERIVLTRPAVEAGENLGYLPGDLIEKINPYLRPLYDALFILMPFERISKYMENKVIEVAPLAYMRGRTLSNSFIILDEAQNTTIAQMKMFLTRMGNNSRIVISGDDTQIDLEHPKSSGLLHAKKILKGIDDISFIQFNKQDISRHPVVEKIVEAYEKEE
ncbi:MAG: PhoH family protein [Spirochaetes bacterium]|jgi:phosphate starvation-inducible PhoH-like protein|nr:PhoH family protein [Spirochaetota bacterium]